MGYKNFFEKNFNVDFGIEIKSYVTEPEMYFLFGLKDYLIRILCWLK